MSHLILIRHGQASFLEANYDKLSPRGEEQARLLGEYWARNGVAPDAVYSGPRVRQQETARIAAETSRQAGLPWPETVTMHDFDEFAGEAVLEQCLPRLLKQDQEIARLHREFKTASTRPDQFRTFQKVFEAVMAKWIANQLETEGLESWQEFCSRVAGGYRKLTSAAGNGRRVAVFTSGGPIGVAMQEALGLAPDRTLKAAFMTRNCGYSEFVFSGELFSLSTYNSTPHLTDPEMITYR